MLNESPVFSDSTRQIIRNYESLASEIAEWHITEKKNGSYGALVSQVTIDDGDPSNPIQCSLLFKGIPSENSLALNLEGESAILVESSDAKFDVLAGKLRGRECDLR